MIDFDRYLARTRSVESGGKDNAKNPRSSASGRYQFINSTYLPYARELNPEMDDNSLLMMKNDPTLQTKVMKRFTEDNLGRLQKSGIQPSEGAAYLAHFAGPAGAINLFKADPTASVKSVLGSAVIKANPHLRGMTAGDTINWANKKMGGGSATPVMGGGSATSEMAGGSATPVMGGGSATSEMAGGDGGDMMASAPVSPETGPTSTPSLGASFLTGGPGALFGAPQENWNIGDALMGASAALLARDKPEAAMAMASMLNKSREGLKKKNNEPQNLGLSPSKKQLMYQMPDGSIKYIQIPEDARAKEEPKTLDSGTLKQFHDYNDVAVSASRMSEWSDRIRNKIIDGKLDVGIVHQGGATLRNLLDKSDENSRNIKDYQSFLENLRSHQLMLQKGVQTEGDAQRALAQFVPGQSQFDNAATLDILDRIHKGSREDLLQNSNAASTALKKAPTYDRVSDTFTYSGDYKKRLEDHDSRESNFRPKYDEYVKKRDSAGKTPKGGSLTDRILADEALRKGQ